MVRSFLARFTEIELSTSRALIPDPDDRQGTDVAGEAFVNNLLRVIFDRLAFE